jgi:hypothetical protein
MNARQRIAIGFAMAAVLLGATGAYAAAHPMSASPAPQSPVISVEPNNGPDTPGVPDVPEPNDTRDAPG